MNKENITKLADHLRDNVSDEEFDMKDYTHPCGTPGCIAGHDIALFHPPIFAQLATAERSDWNEIAGGDLGLDPIEQEDLFVLWAAKPLSYITRTDAIRALRYMARYDRLPPAVMGK